MNECSSRDRQMCVRADRASPGVTPALLYASLAVMVFAWATTTFRRPRRSLAMVDRAPRRS